MTWKFVPPHKAIEWHQRLIVRFGGTEGLRDIGLLEGALDRPRNLAASNPSATLEELAALYGTGIAKAHAFTDGNKRIAFVVMTAFLKVHGKSLDTTEAEATRMMLDIAAGTLDETDLREWLSRNARFL